MPSAKQSRGTQAELIARDFLEKEGMSFLQHHWTCRYGELDLVMEDAGEIVFVEVKMRRDHQYGRPEEMVSHNKTRKLMRTAEAFINQQKLYEQFWRFDIIAISGSLLQPEISHFTDVLRIDS